MKFIKHYPGGNIPQNNRWWFVILHGSFVRKVDLKNHLVFPELEDPNMYYVAYG